MTEGKLIGVTHDRNPWVGLASRPQEERVPWLPAILCLLISILPSYSVLAGPLKSYGSPAKLIALVLFALAILGFALTRRNANGLTASPGTLLIAFYFLAWTLLYGIGLSQYDTGAQEATGGRAFIVLAMNVGIALYVIGNIKTVRQQAILLGCLAIGLTFNCIVGFLQTFAHIDIHLLFQPPGFVVNVNDQGASLNPKLTERSGVERAYGTSTHPIEFSVLAAVTVPIALHFARYATSRQTRLFAALATGCAFLAMPSGVSRSGVVALVAALFIYMWTLNLRQFTGALVTGCVALAAVTAITPRTVEALWTTITNSAEDGSVLSRVRAYAKVSETFHDHPFFGLGLGGSPVSEYGFLDNEWAQALVQGGLVGLAAMLTLALAGMFGMAAALRRATSPRERDQVYATGAMFVGLLASSFTFDILTYQQTSLVLFLAVGLLWSGYRVDLPTSSQVKDNDFLAAGA